MTRSTKQMILITVSTIASLGVVGWVIYKVGLLDLILWAIVEIALMFPMMLVFFYVLNPDTYQLMNDELNAFKDVVLEKFSKGKEIVETEHDRIKRQASEQIKNYQDRQQKK